MSEFQKSFSRILCTIKFGCKSHQSHAVNRLQKSLINLIRFGSMYYSLRAVGTSRLRLLARVAAGRTKPLGRKRQGAFNTDPSSICTHRHLPMGKDRLALARPSASHGLYINSPIYNSPTASKLQHALHARVHACMQSCKHLACTLHANLKMHACGACCSSEVVGEL